MGLVCFKFVFWPLCDYFSVKFALFYLLNTMSLSRHKFSKAVIFLMIWSPPLFTASITIWSSARDLLHFISLREILTSSIVMVGITLEPAFIILKIFPSICLCCGWFCYLAFIQLLIKVLYSGEKPFFCVSSPVPSLNISIFPSARFLLMTFTLRFSTIVRLDCFRIVTSQVFVCFFLIVLFRRCISSVSYQLR